MSSTDDTGESASRRLIREAKEAAWHARRELRRELPEPSIQAKRDLATALADYRDLLLDYRSERALDTPWEERETNVDIIVDLLGRTTTRFQRLNRRGSASSEMAVPLVDEADPQLLIDIGKELDAIAKELGFAAAAKDPTPEEEASIDDLRGLVKARGQEQALEHLPGGDDE